MLNENAKLTASDGADGDTFGADVAISGNTIVAGSDGLNYARVFVRSYLLKFLNLAVLLKTEKTLRPGTYAITAKVFAAGELVDSETVDVRIERSDEDEDRDENDAD